MHLTVLFSYFRKRSLILGDAVAEITELQEVRREEQKAFIQYQNSKTLPSVISKVNYFL